jgi:hypothetical protein
MPIDYGRTMETEKVKMDMKMLDLKIDILAVFSKMVLERSYRYNDFSITEWRIFADTMENL